MRVRRKRSLLMVVAAGGMVAGFLVFDVCGSDE